jgi:dolichyl-phosphate beta-glucosyltransferase
MAHSTAPQPDLSVVIPAFNEVRRIGPTLSRINDYAAARSTTPEVIVVDDGSIDGTGDFVRSFHAPHLNLRVIPNPGNRGKGYSVRNGMLQAQGRMRLLCDADMSTPIDEVDRLIPYIDQGFDIVIGSRALPDSRLDPAPPLSRRLLTLAFRLVRGMIMLPDIRDTQCGFKLFSSRAANILFPLSQIDGFAFDCELLALARKFNLTIREVGVLWQNDRASTVRPMHVALPVLMELWRIRRRVNQIDPAKVPPSPSI